MTFHESGVYLLGEPDGTPYFDSLSKDEVAQFSSHAKNIAKIQAYLDLTCASLPANSG